MKYKYLKVGSYIGQYPILRNGQSALHSTSLTDLFNQTLSQLLWEVATIYTCTAINA